MSTVSEKPVNVKDTALNVTITPEEFRLIDNRDGVTVTVDNEFTHVDGGLIISKFVTGDAVSHAPDEFTVNYRCVAPTYGDDAALVPPVTTDGTETTETAENAATEEEPSLEEEVQEILDATNLNDSDVGGNDDESDESFAAAVLNTLTDVEGVTLGDDNLLATGQVQEGTVTLTNGKSVVIEGIIPGSESEVWEDPAPAQIRPGFLGSGGKPGADWNVEYTLDGQPAGEPVQFTIEAGANSQVIVENQYSKTEENGLIIIPIPIPIPIPGDGGSSILPGGPGSSLPGGSSAPDGSSASSTQTPAQPGNPGQPAQAAPVKEQPAKAAPALAVTGANVLWVGGLALLLVALGALFVVRARRNEQ
ncbi:MAG TPA: DUF5979 domain-containing protein [Corynebacterium pollutisoli]|nr:DUF5979 domain-containing protein [Corynebacterium pollutisoli]